MNLIEKLGLEKCRQIVDGAPEDATDYEVLFNNINYMQQHNGKWYWFSDVAKEWYLDCMDGLERFSLADLRTALANHNSKPCQHGYDIACLICGFGTENGVIVWRKQIEKDNVTDIKNHISPNTKVIER